MSDKPNETAVLAFFEAYADWAMANADKLQGLTKNDACIEASTEPTQQVEVSGCEKVGEQ
jgi:hypothetical protein